MSLNRLDFGNSIDRPPLLIAHGLYGSARNFGAICKRMSADRKVSAVDMRNHGMSPWHPSHSYLDMAGDLLKELDRGSDLLGHSMGGKAAMVAALKAPDHIRRLVVADIAPTAYSHTQVHLIQAMRSVDLSMVQRRSDADTALTNLVPETGVRAFLLQSLDVAERRWRLNLDVLQAEMPKIMDFPEIEGVFEGPTLFLTGAESDYVLPEHRAAIRAMFPAARFAKLPGAGHWLHADRPRDFQAAVEVFLDAA